MVGRWARKWVSHCHYMHYVSVNVRKITAALTCHTSAVSWSREDSGMRSSLRPTTRCCSASLTICSGVFRPLQQVLLPVLDVVSTSRQSWGLYSMRNFMRQRIEFQLTVLVYKALNGLRSTWRMTASLPLQSAADDSDDPIVQRRHAWGSKSLGDRSFIVAGPHLRKNLPLRGPPTWLWTYSVGIPPVVEDAPVLPRTAVPSDWCF